MEKETILFNEVANDHYTWFFFDDMPIRERIGIEKASMVYKKEKSTITINKKSSEIIFKRNLKKAALRRDDITGAMYLLFCKENERGCRFNRCKDNAVIKKQRMVEALAEHFGITEYKKVKLHIGKDLSNSDDYVNFLITPEL